MRAGGTLLKVLHLAPTLGCGGAEKQLSLLCGQTLARVRHQVLAIAAGGRWAGTLREMGVQVDCLGGRLRSPATWLRIASRIRSANPDLVHCWLPSANLLGALLSGGRPVISSVRNVDSWKPIWYRWLDRMAAGRWHAVICNSHAGAADMVRSGIDARRVHVVCNGLPAPPPAAPVERARRTVLTVSRLVRQKRLDRVLDAARRLPDWQFQIAGDGPERSALEQVAPPNVTFLGQVSDPRALLSAASFFVLASEREGMSNALLEAMQAGCVPVVTPVGDNARIVADGSAGVITPPDAIADALLRAEPDWESFSAAAQAQVRRFSVAAMAAQTLEVYEHACSLSRLHQLDRPRWRAA